MSRTLYLATALGGALLVSPLSAWAQSEQAPVPPPAAGAPSEDTAPTPPPPPPPRAGAPGAMADEFQRIRDLLDRQTMQIEMLAREISQLRRRLDAGGAPAAPAAGTPPEAAPMPQPSAPEAGASAAAGATTPPPPEIPRAEATGGGVKHIVAKGETLTSIAKNYNIPVATLQKANKIQDGRKLQIGQVLSIPTTPEPASPEKKETP